MKTPPLIYMAHPIKPIEGETIAENIHSAIYYYHELVKADIAVVAPYLLPLWSQWEDDNEPDTRERALKRGEIVVSRCDGVVLCGPRVSEGMQREAAACCGWLGSLDAAGYEAKFVASGVRNWIERRRKEQATLEEG